MIQNAIPIATAAIPIQNPAYAILDFASDMVFFPRIIAAIPKRIPKRGERKAMISAAMPSVNTHIDFV
jgi:hypothetical protein